MPINKTAESAGRISRMRVENMKYIAALILLIFPVFAHSESGVKKQRDKQRENVDEQRAGDAKIKADLLKQMKAFMSDINGRLGDDGAKLIIPVNPDDADGMDDMYKFHGKNDIPDDYIVPADGKISSRFGTRDDPFSKNKKFHAGIDIAAKKGTPVYASSDGTVNRSGFNKGGYGNLIVIDHGNEISTWYGHLDEILVKEKQKIKKGALIGKVGSTGNSTGPHLHFEVRKGSSTLDPEKFFGK
ncbi:MAG: M23 family metallopeptidase [Spirochaetia bacterium]|jgi:murein DD-endopeptidase MepM/ murein hydrolase activator NlpD|nr:M23 family metallopeptidase [Spirochaetia bacterium]